jgi:hypothetical protein
MYLSRHFPARLLTISGIAGLVIASAALAAPAASAATQDSARAASPSVASAPAAKAPPKACSAAASKSLKVTPNLSSLHATGKYQPRTKKNPAQVVLALTGSPSLGLNLTFKGTVDCTRDLGMVKIPIAGAPALTLKLVPELVFSASGDLQANFTWTENVNVGFTVSGKKFAQGTHSLKSSTQVAFTGHGSAGMQLNLEATVETAAGIIGVQGTVGPDINAKVTYDAESESSCWTGSYTTDANFTAFLNAFFFEERFHSPTWQLGPKVTFENCTDPQDE